jgi:mono/diheme cytochrome c family protein
MVKALQRPLAIAAILAALGVALSAPGAATAAGKADPMLERGKYLVTIGGCNDCHTPGYAASDGKTPEKDWLTGDILGWRGPWGTTYPANLRTYMQRLTEAQWLKAAHTLQARPPMPAVNVRQIKDQDLRAMYRYIRHLGPGGPDAPAYVPPDKTPNPPFVQFPAAP